MDKLKWIKFTVFILTFLLVFCTLYVLGLFLQKTHNKTSDEPININLQQPQGTYIKEFRVENDLLYILAVGGGFEDRVIIYDTQSNKIRTTLKIN